MKGGLYKFPLLLTFFNLLACSTTKYFRGDTEMMKPVYDRINKEDWKIISHLGDSPDIGKIYPDTVTVGGETYKINMSLSGKHSNPKMTINFIDPNPLGWDPAACLQYQISEWRDEGREREIDGLPEKIKAWEARLAGDSLAIEPQELSDDAVTKAVEKYIKMMKKLGERYAVDSLPEELPRLEKQNDKR